MKFSILDENEIHNSVRNLDGQLIT